MPKGKFLFKLLFLLTGFLCVVSHAIANQITVLKVDPQQVLRINVKASCLTSKIALSSPNSNWYTGATLSITNNCGSPQKLNNAVVSFQSNSNNILSLWGGMNGSTDFTYRNGVASTVLLINTDPLQNGKTIVLNFGINLTGSPFNLAAANNTLTVTPDTPTPTNGEIDVTVNPAGVTGINSAGEIDITGPGLTQPYIILNSNWNSPTTYKVTGLAYGTYNISVQPLGGIYVGTATPAAITINSATPGLVAVTYKSAPSTGALQINLGNAPMQGLAATVNATVTDNTNSQSQVVNVAWNSFKLIESLPVGHNYTVVFPNVSNGVLLSSPNAIEHPIILQNRTTPLNVSYQQAQSVPSQNVIFNVSGLTTNVTGSLKIVDNFGNQFTKSNFSNGQVTQALPVNDSFAVTASAPGMFATVTPSSFTLKNGTPAPTISVVFTVNQPPASSSNFLAFADTGMQTNRNGLVPPKGANMVEAFILYNPFVGKTTLWAIEEGDAISQIIKNTPNTFASVGGANGPYPWDYQTVAQALTDIEALVDYYKFVGIDFDVEGAALETPSVQTWVAQAVLQLRRDRPNLILTLTVPDPVIGFTTGTVAILNKTLSANNNKMVFNWVNKMNFDENGLGNGCTQTDTNMNNNCLVRSAETGIQQLATILNISQQQAAQYLGETFMIPVDDQGHALPLSLATTVATTVKNLGVTHMGYWRLQNDDTSLSYGNMYTHILGLS